MQQTDFSAFPGSNEFAKNPQVRSKVPWIIHRSYPQTDVAQVAAAAGVPAITASLTGDTHTNHLLVVRSGRWQTLIIAKTKQVTVTARGEVSWAPAKAPSPSPSPSPSPTPSASTPTPGQGIPAKKPGLPRTGG